MSSTYSPNLRIELIGTGDQAGNWGTTTNLNLGTLIEDSISGYVSVSVTSANQALTASNGVADQSRNATIRLTTTTSANFAVYAPPAEKQYVIHNASSYTATVYNSTAIGNTTAAGAGVAVPAGKTVTMWSDGTNFYFQNSHLSSLTLTTDLAIADGGTGASTASAARTNLGLAIGTDVQAYDADLAAIAGLSNADGNIIVGNGTTWVAESGATARASLGLTIGTNVQAYDADLSAIAGLSNADGNIIVGNGTTWVAESGATARTSLGLAIGTDVQAYDADLTTIAGLSSADGNFIVGSATGWVVESGATARTSLGLTIGTDVQAYDADLTAIAGLSSADGNFIVGSATGWVAESGSTARTSLGLGTIATQNSNDVSISGGSISGITDLAIADGGTGASTAADARTNLGLGSLATLSSISNDNWSGTDLAVANGGTGASSAVTARINLGLVIGTDVQPNNTGLTDIAGLNKDDGNIIVGNGTNWVAESGATARTSLGLGTIATQNANAVAITGGDATGLTSFGTAGFTVTESGTKLVISYSGTAIFSISSTGVITALSDVVSNGTP